MAAPPLDPPPADGPGTNELGRALRRWRGRTDPAGTGLPVGRRRRTSGLRREELAALAGMSVDYVVRLEQGRASSPSAQILTAMARALRLSEEERRHLFLLAGRRPPSDGRMPARLTPGVRRLLEQLHATPVGVFDAAWTLLAWNPLYAALMGDPGRLRGWERNILWRHFSGRPERVSHSAEQAARFEAAAVADLRAATARYPSDPQPRSLTAELHTLSERFTRLWDAHACGAHTMSSKTVHHPEAGPLELDCDVLVVPGSELRVVIHTAAAGTDGAAKLALLGTDARPDPAVRPAPVLEL
ncbi:helix-turn-helix transcriptional regulator [Streptomyces sp. NBC_01775]|uniref:helix-turn-helix transcriptional regulator n=1 Tax=Streptomyces sp. NBC_01775 TaxID=2975939 RepID=UPI002DDB86DB|nr:helix-turn-helix transcriptional regulator [Streptomyces sp. NBC_01775]WSB75496.1 helix-turn-helix transcriptional regulator [Streptomyces sp. NBC_01775]